MSCSSRRRRDEGGEAGRLLRVHPRRRLVEQQQPRLGRERARHLEPPLVAVGEVLRVLLRLPAQPGEAEQLACRGARPPPPRAFRRGVRTIEAQIPPLMRLCMATSTFSSDGHAVEEPDVLERARHPELRHLVRRQPAGSRLPSKRTIARGRLVDAGEHVEERRLAGAVRADQADDRALRDGEVDVVHGDEAAELLPHLDGLEQVAVGRSRAHSPRRSVEARPPRRPPRTRPCGVRSGSAPRGGTAS